MFTTIMYFIAEIGVNFFDIAKKYNISLIDACKMMIIEAKHSGAHCVKFQCYKADTITTRDAPAYWDTTQEKCKNQFELFKKFDSFNESDYRTLSIFCKENDIDFMCTPFDIKSVDFLDKYLDRYKISSSDISNFQLLKAVAMKQKTVLLSTGASNIQEIKEAVNILEEYGCPEVVIMHCILNYPTPNEEANLNMITDLKRNFPNYLLGYSDHTIPDTNMLILTHAFLLGATYIEKHFTLDKNLEGNDHYHSADPSDVKKFMKNISLIDICGGTTSKKCIASEQKSRENARRSIVTTTNIKKGEVFTSYNITCKRPATGLPASMFFKILNQKANKNIDNDTVLQKDMIDFS